MRKMSDIVRNQDPLTLPPDATVREACRCMQDRRVGAVLVIENDGRLAGIFTGRDAVHRVLAEDKSAGETKLAEVMTRDPARRQDGDRGTAAHGRRPLPPHAGYRRRQSRRDRVPI